MSLSVVILAAGKGTRMKSSRPKVIHELAGKPMVNHVVDCARQLSPQQILLVVGHESEQVKAVSQDAELIFVEQQQQLGTGHALMQCMDQLTKGNDILVLYGDVPLIRSETLKTLQESSASGFDISLLSFIADNPTGYGRIVRSENEDVMAIVEEKDADTETRKIRESNSGIMLLNGEHCAELLNQLDDNNAQREFYLTDTVKHAVAKGLKVAAVIGEEQEVLGVNNQQQLAEIEQIYRKRCCDELMIQGVKLVDPSRTDVRGNVTVGHDVIIDANVILEGDIVIGDAVRIGANCVIKNSTIGAGTIIQSMSVIEDAKLGMMNDIGPFARIRPNTITMDKAKIGNFVEVKKSVIGEGSKVNHLTYIGDTEMGNNVNIGAGTITCNYDGAYKHKTVIGDNVFVGSDTQLVAPVTLANNSTIGAGSTITKDTLEDKLTLSRSKQVTINNWTRPVKNK